MLVALSNNAKIVVMGSYDDVVERNAWLVADTSDVPLERQMRGTDGALSTTAFYERVKEWAHRIPSSAADGPLSDGAYMILGSGAAAGGLMMQGNSAAVNTPLVAVTPDSGRRDILHWYSSCNQCGRSVCQPTCQPHCC